MLREQGYKVRGAPNGDIALNAVHSSPPDVILLDINMPGKNGYDVCRELKAHEDTSKIPVIFLSALDEPLDKVAAFDVGGADYVSKPFQIEEVLARVDHQLRLLRLQEELHEAPLTRWSTTCAVEAFRNGVTLHRSGWSGSAPCSMRKSIIFSCPAPAAQLSRG
jgi:DNA-binding response OmpR family regulator